MKRYAIKFSVIASITFFIMMIVCILFDHRSDTPWWYYVLTSLGVAVTVAGIGAFLNGIVPAAIPDPGTSGDAVSGQGESPASDPYELLDEAAKLPGGRWIAISLMLGLGVGLVIALFNGWLSLIWESRESVPKWGRLLFVYSLIGSAVFAAGCGLVGWFCSRLRKAPFLAVTISSLVMFTGSIVVTAGGSYATASMFQSAKDSADKARQRSNPIKGRSWIEDAKHPNDKK